MVNIKTYNPFNTKDYYILEKEGKKYFNYKNSLLELCDGGYVPKSGLLYDMVLDPKSCEGKDVLDLGCGYLGILGMIAYFNGAKSVDSIDCDPECIKWFNKLIKDNRFQNMNCFESDYFQNVKRMYDMILANPPQMPMISGSVHDSGGIDGREYILQILKESLGHLKKDGDLYVLMFDFLGLDRRTGDMPSILEISKDYGYQDTELVYSADKEIKKGSVTEESIPHIQSIYPYYDFGEEEKKCKINILRFRK
ncbi:MAG: methyltransferase [Bacilli bacterium]|nr:methyltransferase [Bacilli bacterium]